MMIAMNPMCSLGRRMKLMTQLSIRSISLSVNNCGAIGKKYLNEKMMETSGKHGKITRFRSSLQQSDLFLTCKKTAKMMATHVSGNLSEEKGIIFDASPGNGLLVGQLLHDGAKRVRVFEENKERLNELNVSVETIII